MAWTAPADKSTGDVVTAAIWNAALGTTGNMAQTAPAKVTTNGDMVYATGANALTRLGIGSEGQGLLVTSGVPAWGNIASSQSTGIRTDFRANRTMRALWSGPTYSYNMGFGSVSGPASGSITTINGEAVNQATGTGVSRLRAAGVGVIAPNKNPRMLCRIQFPAASANITFCEIGFFDTPHASTADGAYLRIVTTGNVYFVTQNGVSETTTDLGALSRTTILGFEIETADAGVTWVCRNQAGTVLATHTTNVPTVTTALDFGFESSIATAGVVHGVVSMVVEATTA